MIDELGVSFTKAYGKCDGNNGNGYGHDGFTCSYSYKGEKKDCPNYISAGNLCKLTGTSEGTS